MKSLVSMHGGMVTVHSDGEGKGSDFVVRLPLNRQGAGDEPAPSPRTSRGRCGRERESSLSRTAPTAAISFASCSRRPDSDARLPRAASRARVDQQIRPAVAILDVGLPEMDGFELARRVRASTEHRDMVLIA